MAVHRAGRPLDDAAADACTGPSRTCSGSTRTGRTSCRRWRCTSRRCAWCARSAGATASGRGPRPRSSALLLVFGSGWEDIVFAIQLVYNLSLVAFLAMVLLVDHDGPPDRRDAWAAVLGGAVDHVVGVRAVLPRRHRRAAGAAPALGGAGDRRRAAGAALRAGGGSTWGEDPVGATSAHTLTGTARVRPPRASPRRLNGITGQVLFAGAAFLGIVGDVRLAAARRGACARRASRSRGTVVAFFVGIGYQRAGLGLEHRDRLPLPVHGGDAARAAARAGDRSARTASTARALLVGCAVIAVCRPCRTRDCSSASPTTGPIAPTVRVRLFSLVAADPRTSTADPALHISAFNPDVNLASLPQLRDAGLLDVDAVAERGRARRWSTRSSPARRSTTCSGCRP